MEACKHQLEVFELDLLANQQLQADRGTERRLREQVRRSVGV